MTATRAALVVVTFAAVLPGCGAAPPPPSPRAVPAKVVTPASQPVANAAPAVASERWFVPYFTPLRVSDEWSPDGALTIAYADDGSLLLYQARAAAPLAPLAFPRSLYDGVWSPDGRSVAGLTREELVVVDSATRQLRFSLPAPAFPATWGGHERALLGFVPDSRRVAVLGANGDVLVVDPSSGALERHDLGVVRVARLAPGHPWVAYNRGSGFAIYDLEQHRELVSDPRQLTPVAWHSSGEQLAATASGYSVVFAPGRPTIQVPVAGSPRWNDRGTLLGFEGRESCSSCLRQFGLTAIFDLATRRATSSDAFVPDGPRYGASFDHLQERATGVVRLGVPVPFELQKPRMVKVEDEHTLLFHADGWGARIDLARVQVLASGDDGVGTVYPNDNQIVTCEHDLFTVHERFTGKVLGTLAANCAATLSPFDGSLYQLRDEHNASTQVVDLSDGKVLARMVTRLWPLPWRQHWLIGTSGDGRESRCQVFDATQRRFYETAPVPLDREHAQCVTPGVLNSTGAVNPKVIFVSTEGHGSFKPDGTLTTRAVSFCQTPWMRDWGVGCFEAGRAHAKLRLFIHGKGVRTLVIPAAKALHRLELAADEQHLAFTIGDQTYVADLRDGKLAPWGPAHFIPRSFSDDWHTLQGELVELSPNGFVAKVIRRVTVRDGVEVPEVDAQPPLVLGPGFGFDHEYQAFPSGRTAVRSGTPVTLVRYADGRSVRLLVARKAGKVLVAAVDADGHYAGDPELTRQLLFAEGTSPRDAVLVPDRNNEHYRPELMQRFLDGQD